MKDVVLTWRVAHSFAILLIAYAGVYNAVPYRPLMLFLNSLAISIAVAVVVTFAPVWISTLLKRSSEVDGTEWLSLGVGSTWTAEIVQRMWSITWRGLDQPHWMTATWITPFALVLTIAGGVMHVTSPGSMNGIVPRRNWIVLGVSTGAAVFLFLMTMWLTGFRLE